MKGNYSELIDKVKGKLQAWKGKMLSYEDKEVFITSVLQSRPIYIPSAIVPLVIFIKKLHRIY